MSNLAVAQIDENDRPTMLAYNETTSAPEAIRCDAVFDYLEVYIAGNASGTYTAMNRAKIDANKNPTLLGYNETTGLVQALRCDDNGNLLVKLI